MSFEEFIKVVCEQDDQEMNIHYRPQSSLTHYRDQPVFDHLCKLERLDEDWRDVQHNILARGLAPLPDLEKRNSTKSEWRNLYTDELFDLVRYRYAEDVIRFGYEGGL